MRAPPMYAYSTRERALVRYVHSQQRGRTTHGSSNQHRSQQHRAKSRSRLSCSKQQHQQHRKETRETREESARHKDKRDERRKRNTCTTTISRWMDVIRRNGPIPEGRVGREKGRPLGEKREERREKREEGDKHDRVDKMAGWCFNLRQGCLWAGGMGPQRDGP